MCQPDRFGYKAGEGLRGLQPPSRYTEYPLRDTTKIPTYNVYHRDDTKAMKKFV